MQEIVGIDVSKAKLDCLWLRDRQSQKVKTKVLPNTLEGHQQLIHWLSKTLAVDLGQVQVVIEATGVYHESLAYALHASGVEVIVVNPAYVKRFAESLGRTHKTDKQDSLTLALYGATQTLTRWQPEAPEIRHLKALIARLEALEKDYQRESNRLEKAQLSHTAVIVIESIQKMLDQLAHEKQRLTSEIDDHIDRHPQLKKDRQLLQSITGIGPVLSRLMLSIIHSRDFKHARELAAYLGLVPRQIESGIFKGKSQLSKKGPARIRAKLYMAAIVASQHNPHIMAQKTRLLNTGKNKMQALGAAMRKLVHLCFGVIKNQTEYSPQAR